MRLLSRPVVLLAVAALAAAPVPALAQASQSVLEGQATAVQMTRAQALHAIERAGYRDVTKLTLGTEGIWTAMTDQGAVKVDPAGEVTKSP